MSDITAEATPYGIVGEFVRPDEVASLVRRLRLAGIRHLDVFSPTPIEELDRMVAPRPRRPLVLVMVVGGCIGAFLCYFMQYYAAVISYPINVGGRPYNSWPAFVPVSWEICALFTVYAGFFAFLLFCRLPRLHHPIFNTPRFERASQDRFFLCVEARDPHYNFEKLSRIFEQYNVLSVTEVPQ